MKVVSYYSLFGDPLYVSTYEEHILVKDGVKYLPLKIVESAGFKIYLSDVQEVDFE